MNYKKIYDNLISLNINRKKDTNMYYEKHHIVPKSLGGSNKKNNIVYLTAREHYLAHWLLYKLSKNINEKEKMGRAWMYMCCGNKNQNKKITSKEHERAKKVHVVNMANNWKINNPTYSRDVSGNNNPNFGNYMSDVNKDKISFNKKKMWLDSSSIYNSEEYRENKSKAVLGSKNPMYNKKHTEDTKRKISIANKGKLSGSKNPKARKIRLVSPDGEEFYTFGNLKGFCEQHDLTPSAIIMVCKCLRKQHKNWTAKYENN